MSGGVDSSVAACLLRESGDEVAGVTMKLFENADIGQKCQRSCCSLKDADDARAVAAKLNIPFYIFNYSDEFRRQVMARFVLAYRRGLTPNPCIDCNRFLKFDLLHRRAKGLGFDKIATGHYARIEQDTVSGRNMLLKAADPAKDQSYVLYCLTQEQLADTLFPLGELTKQEVREIAEMRGLINAKKRDSQDICFVPDGDYAAFIEQYTGETFPEGDFVGSSGEILGRHRGIIRYTIGQRKGLGLAVKAPLYVLEKRARDNTVALGFYDELFSRRVAVEDFNFVAAADFKTPCRVKAKIRYRHAEQPAIAEQTGESTVLLEFDEPQRAVSPGQAAVVYDGDAVLGGGTIC
jgi:tRNA-specific 2-thiouridylase